MSEPISAVEMLLQIEQRERELIRLTGEAFDLRRALDETHAKLVKVNAALKDAARPELSPLWVPRSWHDGMMADKDAELVRMRAIMDGAFL
jgi:hypothetical protein